MFAYTDLFQPSFIGGYDEKRMMNGIGPAAPQEIQNLKTNSVCSDRHLEVELMNYYKWQIGLVLLLLVMYYRIVRNLSYQQRSNETNSESPMAVSSVDINS